ncbi:hypothetical protein SEUCBS139899_002986 [Sporothrix eucalyptigena]|uniref:Uncharacterized protein n=1 Tax=Sporothrix eucalyptigena TaxID=1812306 RepID=A0ABP0C860_9PEZI
MTYTPVLIPVAQLLPLGLFIFVAVGGYDSLLLRALPFVVFLTITLMQFRLIAYYYQVLKLPGLVEL